MRTRPTVVRLTVMRAIGPVEGSPASGIAIRPDFRTRRWRPCRPGNGGRLHRRRGAAATGRRCGLGARGTHAPQAGTGTLAFRGGPARSFADHFASFEEIVPGLARP